MISADMGEKKATGMETMKTAGVLKLRKVNIFRKFALKFSLMKRLL